MAVGGAVNVFIHTREHFFNLLIQLGAVGDDQHPRPRHVLANPFGQPHHGQALAAALCMPDDAALTAVNELLRGLDPKVLVLTAQLFDACVKHHVIVHQLQ